MSLSADFPTGDATAANRQTPDWRLERLVIAGLALTSEASLQRVLRRVAEVAAEVLDAHYTAIGVLAADGRTLEDFVTHGITEAERARMGTPPVGHGLLGTVIREARPIRVARLSEHPDTVGFPPHHPPMNTFLGVPISGPRGAIGNLYATEKLDGGQFSEDDEHIAVLLAAIAGAAVENARLHEESGRLLAEVHQLHRHRERFFAMVNHELRNSLAAVLGWSELLVRRKDPADVPPAAFEVLDSAESAVALISDLLDLSRLDEDRLRPVIRPVDSGSLCGRAIGRVMPAARAKEIRISVSRDAALPVIETDASRVEQILVNLLTNAVKYTPERTTVLVHTTNIGDNVCWTVEDEGPGIRPEQAERIFDIYVTAADGEKQGIGLGLPLSRRLAQLLGGDLVAIAGTGGGRFVLRLPTARP